MMVTTTIQELTPVMIMGNEDNDGNDLYVSNLPTDEMEFISLLDHADTSGGITL